MYKKKKDETVRIFVLCVEVRVLLLANKGLMDKAPLIKERYWSYCHADED